MSLLTRLFGSRDVAVSRNGHDAPFLDNPFERRVQEVGRAFLDEARGHKLGLLSARFWNDKLMDWAMSDDTFKVQLFRFVDAFPTLTSPESIYEHLTDYLSQPGVKAPPGLSLGLKAGGVMKGAVAKTMASQITGMAEKFIAGQDARSAVPKLRKLWEDGLAFSVDLLGEACISDREADEYQRKYLDLVENLPKWVDDFPANERLESDHLGRVPRTNVSIKVSSLSARTDPSAFEQCIAGSMERIVPILEAAKNNGVFINFDVESHATKDLTIELFKRCCSAVDFDAGLAMQAYLRSGDADAADLIAWAKREGRVVTVRLVKGAYWDYETIHAEQMGWPVPVWATKRETDACFERMTRAFIDSTPATSGEGGGIKLALGSHNVRSITVGLAELERRGLPADALELQMLHGMADPLKAAAVERGLRVREYVPVGDLVPGMAYLVRRLLENTSNESWLKAGFLDNATPEELLAAPASPRAADGRGGFADGCEASVADHGGSANGREGSADVRKSVADARRARRHGLSAAVDADGFDPPTFFSEPMRDFADARQREAFAAAVASATVPNVANDSTTDDADRAVAAARAAFPSWRDADAVKRSRCFVKAAALMRSRRDELSGVVLKENAKDWRNADADVCEAIDFCEFYAREAVGLFQPQRLGKFVGELNETWHEPRGACAVISPWNFPLAIACGMATAALVTGNCVILKPAEQTPGVAKLLCEILWEAGVPRDVLHLLPGVGETVGARLTEHDGVDMVAFTGSSTVGRAILKASVEHPPRGRLARHVVCETGGKNAIIVDASADLDEAVVGVRDSAFSFAGQKCSACSRVIVVDSAYDAFLNRLVESTRSLNVGDPLDPSTDVGPVIDDEAAEKIVSYITVGTEDSQLAYPPSPLQQVAATQRVAVGRTRKPLVPPHIFRDVAPDAKIATEEIFGPVLAVIRAKDFDDALRIANGSNYKLTGGLYSRKPAHLQKARRAFRVGNLYLNRSITGAAVARQPFGGFGMSGLGSKAGGRDYLLQFVEPRCVTENTMRRGFAPGLEEQGQVAGGDTASLRAGV